jgi:hypothetical protein
MRASAWAFVCAACALVFHTAPAIAACETEYRNFQAVYKADTPHTIQDAKNTALNAIYGRGWDSFFSATMNVGPRPADPAVAARRWADLMIQAIRPDDLPHNRASFILWACFARAEADRLDAERAPPPPRIPNSAPPAPPGPIVSGPRRPPQGDADTDSDSDAKDDTPDRQRVASNAPRRKLPKPPEKKKIKGEVAHACLALLKDPGTYGGFHNNCGFKVHYMYCAYHPNLKTDAKWADCAQVKAGSDGIDGIGANSNQGGFTQSAEKIYWFACKSPSTPKGLEFKLGLGVTGRCG